MKKILLISLFLVCVFSLFAKKPETIHIKSLDMTLVKVPGGIFMSQEITNGQYLSFINDLKAQGKHEEAERNKLDSLVWNADGYSYGEPMRTHYSTHPAFFGYPAVGITVEQAKAFCAWLTDKIKQDTKLNLPKAICGLPTENEWVVASAPFMDNPYPWYGPYAYNEKGEMLCNVKLDRVDVEYYDYYGAGSLSSIGITAPPNSFYPNKYGLYNMIGNVAELTSEGYIKGGGWDNTIDECAVNKRLDVELPSANVGFRIVLRPNGEEPPKPIVKGM